MNGFNRIILMGTLIDGPKLKTVGQTQVCEFEIEIIDTYTKKDDTTGENTCRVKCECWGRRGEVIAQYFNIGMPILIEGKLILDTWDYQGKPYSKLQVKVDNFTFVGSPERDEREPEQTPKQRYDNEDGIPF